MKLKEIKNCMKMKRMMREKDLEDEKNPEE